MGTTTTTFALNKPTVGGDDNAWGTDLNANADKLDDLLDGTTGITPNLLTGWEVGGTAVTATAAELNILDGVTASAAEINVLDGVTVSTAELNILDGVTASAAELNILDGATLTVTELNYVDGVTSAIQTQLDAKYDSGDIASQAEAEAGTDNTKVMTPLRTAQASGWRYLSANQTLTLDGSGTLAHSLGATPTDFQAFLVCTTSDLGWAIGDIVLAPLGFQIGGSHYGVTLGADATNMYFAIGSNIQIRNKSTTTTFGNITASSWRLVVRAR